MFSFYYWNHIGLRHVRPDNSLVFPPFRAEDYRQNIHSNVYKCVATNPIGTIKSRDIIVKAGQLSKFLFTIFSFALF